MKRRDILTVQGCSGCGTPRKRRVAVQVPAGLGRLRCVSLWNGWPERVVFNTLRLVPVPGVVSVSVAHPRHAPIERKRQAYSLLCKACRKLAREER